jgi:N-acetylglucosaminyldiphosphoundecaprenol N-acetyl-beta-D-mannosaminyltransferase
MPARIEILDVPVDAVDMTGALDFLCDHIATGTGCATVFAVNPEKVMRARQDSALRDLLASATLLIPDGIGVVLAARWLGLGRFGRVPGSELMPNLCARAAARGYGVFLFGARPEVNEAAADTLVSRYPGLTIAGRQDGYVKEEAMAALVDRINASGAAILFVALGSPRQEAWMHDHAPALKVKVAQGVGGTFDVIAGRVNRAPPLFLALNLEWLYRLLREPRRLWRQRVLLVFAGCVAGRFLRPFLAASSRRS